MIKSPPTDSWVFTFYKIAFVVIFQTKLVSCESEFGSIFCLKKKKRFFKCPVFRCLARYHRVLLPVSPAHSPVHRVLLPERSVSSPVYRVLLPDCVEEPEHRSFRHTARSTGCCCRAVRYVARYHRVSYRVARLSARFSSPTVIFRLGL